MSVIRRVINSFSKLSSSEKVAELSGLFPDPEEVTRELTSYLFSDGSLRESFMGFSENTISSYHLPYGIVPNLLLDDIVYHVPVVTEESSVVAAASSSVKFWGTNGGFRTLSVRTVKVGQIHFTTTMEYAALKELIATSEQAFREALSGYTARMQQRGGGIVSFKVIPIDNLHGRYQLLVEFETVGSMGANFINTCLEELVTPLKRAVEESGYSCEVLMAILSNYTPDCTVRVGVSAPVSAFNGLVAGMDGETFANRFAAAVAVASNDVYRATTHNKGIMNGVDSVVIATGNDFRAVEAASHAYASRKGCYSSLSTCMVSDGSFTFKVELPLALGVVGGLTSLHPLAKRSLELLGNPSAEALMAVAASIGLASNFAAVKALVTGGIQQGHMKMHLSNILQSYNATPGEVAGAISWFANRKVSNLAVKEYLDGQRG